MRWASDPLHSNLQGYNSFVLVIIDGNRTQFADELVARGCPGGYAAADCARASIEENVKRSSFYVEDDTAIAITVFANLKILATDSSLASLAVRDFAHGFNDTDLLTKFQDVGQSVAQHKRLEKVLGRVLQDDRCLQVVFVGPTWSGFKDFVKHQDRNGQRRMGLKTTAIPLPYFLREVRKRPKNLMVDTSHMGTDISITEHRRYHRSSVDGAVLYDGPPSSTRHIMVSDAECTENSTKFSTSAIDTPYHTDTFHPDSTTPSDVHEESCIKHIQQTESDNNLIGESCARNFGPTTGSPRPTETDVNIKETSTSSSKDFEREDAGGFSNVIPRNRAGQRVDPPIKFDKDFRRKMSGEKWCSNHQLKGLCPLHNCEFKHDHLDQEGRNALLSLARGNPCRNGNGCNEHDCYAGHHCPYNPCKKGRECSFSKQRPDMHIHDKRIVNLEGLLQPEPRHRRTRLGESQPRVESNWR